MFARPPAARRVTALPLTDSVLMYCLLLAVLIRNDIVYVALVGVVGRLVIVSAMFAALLGAH